MHCFTVTFLWCSGYFKIFQLEYFRRTRKQMLREEIYRAEVKSALVYCQTLLNILGKHNETFTFTFLQCSGYNKGDIRKILCINS